MPVDTDLMPSRTWRRDIAETYDPTNADDFSPSVLQPMIELLSASAGSRTPS